MEVLPASQVPHDWPLFSEYFPASQYGFPEDELDEPDGLEEVQLLSTSPLAGNPDEVEPVGHGVQEPVSPVNVHL